MFTKLDITSTFKNDCGFWRKMTFILHGRQKVKQVWNITGVIILIVLFLGELFHQDKVETARATQRNFTKPHHSGCVTTASNETDCVNEFPLNTMMFMYVLPQCRPQVALTDLLWSLAQFRTFFWAEISEQILSSS